MRWLALVVLLVVLAPAARADRTFPGDLLISDLDGQIQLIPPTDPIRVLIPCDERDPDTDACLSANYQGLAEGADGSLFATQGALGAVWRVVPSVRGLALVASSQTVDNLLTLLFPIDVELGPEEEILVLDAGPTPAVGQSALGAVIEVVTEATDVQPSVQEFRAVNGYLADVVQLAAHPNGLLYATSLNTTAQCLPLPPEEVDPDAQPIGAIVAVDPSVDIGDPTANDFDPCVNQEVLARGDPVRNPSGIAVDGDGNLVVASLGDPADIGDQRVVLLDPVDGSVVRTVSEGGQLLCEPQQLSIEADGTIVVADVGIGAVVRVDPAGPATANQTLVKPPQKKECAPPPMNPGDPVEPDDPFGPIGIVAILVPEPAAGTCAAVALALTALLARGRRSGVHFRA